MCLILGSRSFAFLHPERIFNYIQLHYVSVSLIEIHFDVFLLITACKQHRTSCQSATHTLGLLIEEHT